MGAASTGGGGGRLRRWKPSFLRHSSSASSSSPASPSPSIPPEFLCPISGILMADPVILPSGDSFDRSSLAARQWPEGEKPSIIPNSALKAAIFTWCDSHGVPRPASSPAPATHSVRARRADASSLSSSSNLSSSSSSYPSSETHDGGKPEAEEEEEPAAAKESKDDVEEDFCSKMADLDLLEPDEAEAAIAAVRAASRDGPERRLALCTPRLLGFTRRLLLWRHAGVQANAAAALVNLSVEKANKIPIVRSGLVTALVEVLKSGAPEAREHAAGVLFSLALEESNRAPIGVLGAVVPLVRVFSGAGEAAPPRARRDAGLALYHLSLAAANLTKIARTAGAARALLAVAAGEETAAPLRRVAMMILCNLTGCGDGRVALMDSGAVATVTAMMLKSEPGGEEEERCVSVMYGLSRGSLRFRGLAKAAGAERSLARVAEEGVGMRKEMARKTLRAMRADEDSDFITSVCGDEDEDDDGSGSILSEGMVSIRRRHRELFPAAAASSNPNTAEF